MRNIENLVAIVEKSDSKMWNDLKKKGFKLIADYDSSYDMIYYADLNKSLQYIKPADRKSTKGIKRFVRACEKMIEDYGLNKVAA